MKPELTLCLVRIAVTVSAFCGSACMPTAANPLADVSGFCQAKAKAECQVTAVCAIEPDVCAPYRASLCNADATSATASGVRKYVLGNAQACLDALNTAYGSGSSKVLYSQLVGPGSITDTCERVFSGSATTAESCESDYDCANEGICAPVAPGATEMVCAPQVAAVQLCANPGSVCPTNTYCALQPTGAAECVAAAAAGQACGASMPCVSDQRCGEGTCVDRVGPGGACVTSADCGATDPYCDPNAGSICTIGLTFATGADDCRAYEPSGAQMVTVSPTADSGATDAEDAATE